jgi:REP element-mobilizing transposase RayT
MGLYDATEFAYHFTICARHHGAPFYDERLAKVIIDSLIWTKHRYDWILFCYCLMPDHLHFLCGLTKCNTTCIDAGARGIVEESLLDQVGRFKSYTTHGAWKFGIQGHLWQKSSYDRVLDWHRPFQEVAAYILNNPVRRGLVEAAEQWPYSAVIDAW